MITVDEIKETLNNYRPDVSVGLNSKLINEIFENFKKDEQFITQNIVVASNFHDTKEEIVNYIWLEYFNVQILGLRKEIVTIEAFDQRLRKPINLVRVD